MWNENYVVSVEHPIVKVDRFVVSNLLESENEKYEFLFKYTTNLEKIEKFDTKEILVNTYNLGNLVEEKFTYKIKNQESILDIEKNRIIKNIFLKAVYEAHLEFDCRRKSIYEQIQKKLNKELMDNHYTEKERIIFDKEYEKIEHEIYKRKVEEQLTLNNISNNDIEELNELLKKWVETCGLSKPKLGSVHNQQNLFPIILLSHEIYTFIKNEGKPRLEVKITESMTKDFKSEIYVDTVNDLIYFLAMNYFISGKGYYITCEECGKMVAGNKKRKTCSEKCRKRKNRKL